MGNDEGIGQMSSDGQTGTILSKFGDHVGC